MGGTQYKRFLLYFIRWSGKALFTGGCGSGDCSRDARTESVAGADQELRSSAEPEREQRREWMHFYNKPTVDNLKKPKKATLLFSSQYFMMSHVCHHSFGQFPT